MWKSSKAIFGYTEFRQSNNRKLSGRAGDGSTSKQVASGKIIEISIEIRCSNGNVICLHLLVEKFLKLTPNPKWCDKIEMSMSYRRQYKWNWLSAGTSRMHWCTYYLLEMEMNRCDHVKNIVSVCVCTNDIGNCLLVVVFVCLILFCWRFHSWSYHVAG